MTSDLLTLPIPNSGFNSASLTTFLMYLMEVAVKGISRELEMMCSKWSNKLPFLYQLNNGETIVCASVAHASIKVR